MHSCLFPILAKLVLCVQVKIQLCKHHMAQTQTLNFLLSPSLVPAASWCGIAAVQFTQITWLFFFHLFHWSQALSLCIARHDLRLNSLGCRVNTPEHTGPMNWQHFCFYRGANTCWLSVNEVHLISNIWLVCMLLLPKEVRRVSLVSHRNASPLNTNVLFRRDNSITTTYFIFSLIMWQKLSVFCELRQIAVER